MKYTNPLSPPKIAALGLLVWLFALILLAAAGTIPFLFESSSILYKFGMQKTLLRWGKVAGISIVMLFFYQVLLVSHLTFPGQFMNRKLLLTLHRLNGYLITLLAFVHPALIKASENFTPYTFEKKYFPEFVGISLLLLTLTVSIPALFRRHIGISASRWLSLHRFGATLTLAILPLHVLRVSDTFKGGLPYSAALVIFGLNGLFLLRIWFRRVFRH